MKTASDAQTSLRLPVELHTRLAEAAAQNSGRSLGAEIRSRLEASFGSATPPAVDQKTGELLRLIAKLVAYVGKTCGPWHQNPYAHVVIRTGVAELIAKYQPEGEPNPPAGASAAFEGDPAHVGRVLGDIIDVF